MGSVMVTCVPPHPPHPSIRGRTWKNEIETLVNNLFVYFKIRAKVEILQQPANWGSSIITQPYCYLHRVIRNCYYYSPFIEQIIF